MKKILFALALLGCLLQGFNQVAKADILPPQCDGTITSVSCQSYRSNRSYCNEKYGYYSFRGEDRVNDAAVAARREKDSRCSTGGDTTSSNFVCAHLVYSCNGVGYIFTSKWFYVGLFITSAVELGVVFLYSKIKKLLLSNKQLLLTIPLNIATNTLLTIAIVKVSQNLSNQSMYYVVAALFEVVVVVAEALVYKKVFSKSCKESLLISALANAASIIIGIVISYIFVR
jgi:hypothetical protein